LKLTQQIVAGLAFLHENKIIYRSLKPSSIIVRERERKRERKKEKEKEKEREREIEK